MEEFLILLLQFVFEMLLEVLGSLPWDAFSYRWDDKDQGFGLGVLAFTAGCLLGGASLLMFPHTLLHHGWSRIGNLVVAPLLSGLVARSMAKWRERKGREVPED